MLMKTFYPFLSFVFTTNPGSGCIIAPPSSSTIGLPLASTKFSN